MGCVEECGARLLHRGLELRGNRVLMWCEAEKGSGGSYACASHLKFRDNVADNRVWHVIGNMISVSQAENKVQPGYFHLIRTRVTENGN